MKPSGPRQVTVAEYSAAPSCMTVRIIDTIDDSMDSQMFDSDNVDELLIESGTPFNVRDWVVVEYQGSNFPGEVSEILSDGRVEVNVMCPSGNGWKWPEKEDKIPYEIDEVLKKIEPPVPTGSRGQFHVNM